MHINRKNTGRFWPIPRKGTKYIAVSTHNRKSSMPLSVIMRDILKSVKNSKELKKLLNEGKIKINGKEIRDVKYPVGLFDILSFSNKNYRSNFNGKKTFFEEVKNEEAHTKIIKIIGKKKLRDNVIQINLMDGRNIITSEKAEINDSILYDFNSKKIKKVIKMENGSHGFVIKGKHSGQKGKILDIINVGGKELAIIDNKEKITVWTKNIITI